MWRRGWSGANPIVVSPRGKGCSVRGMGGRCNRGGTHSSIALSGSRGSHDGGGGSSCAGAAGRGRGGTAHPGLESASSTSFHHARAREERRNGEGGFRNWKWECEMKRKERKGVLYREGGK